MDKVTRDIWTKVASSAKEQAWCQARVRLWKRRDSSVFKHFAWTRSHCSSNRCIQAWFTCKLCSPVWVLQEFERKDLCPKKKKKKCETGSLQILSCLEFYFYYFCIFLLIWNLNCRQNLQLCFNNDNWDIYIFNYYLYFFYFIYIYINVICLL